MKMEMERSTTRSLMRRRRGRREKRITRTTERKGRKHDELGGSLV